MMAATGNGLQMQTGSLRTQARKQNPLVSTRHLMRPAHRQKRSFMRSATVAKVTAAPGQSKTDSSEATSGEACPYTATKDMISGMLPSKLKKYPVKEGEVVPEYPGPGKNAVRNLADVMYIGIMGMEKATLYFSDCYGPIARFPNPIQLGEAAGWVFLNEPELLAHVCKHNTANYTERFLPDVYAYVTKGQGILGSGGDYNKQQRKMCMPFFQAIPMLKNYSDVVVDRANKLNQVWAKEGNAITTDAAVQMQRLTLDVVGLVAFSHNFGQIDAMEKLGAVAGENEMPTDRILHDINTAQEQMGKVFITPLPMLQLLSKMRAPFMVKMEDAFDDMRQAVMPVIRERREAMQNGTSEERKDDLLEVLLEAQDENNKRGLPPLTDGELWEDVHDVMGAGHETTASTLTAALYSVSQHPEVDTKIQAELEAVLGKGAEARLPTYQDVEQLVYCTQVLKEVLRLYPPIPIFPRVAAGEDTLPTGHPIVKNDVLFMSAYAMGRSDTIWESPMTFDPDRFAPEREEELHKFAWVPFGAGPRMCLGANFAMLSTTLAFVTLMQKNKFRAVKSRGTVYPIAYDITMNFPGLVEMEITRRH